MGHTIGWIWPKDPRPGNRAKWPVGRRFKDVLTNKGPDIFVGRLDGPSSGPHTPRWARWQDLYGDDEDDETTLPAAPWARRGLKRYDFRTRTYRIPNDLTWSSVQYHDWDQGGADMSTPLMIWDGFGIEYPFHDWQALHGGGHHPFG